jgi:hypothetical protein
MNSATPPKSPSAILPSHNSFPRCHLVRVVLRCRWYPRGYPLELRTLSDHLQRRRLDLAPTRKAVASLA